MQSLNQTLALASKNNLYKRYFCIKHKPRLIAGLVVNLSNFLKRLSNWIRGFQRRLGDERKRGKFQEPWCQLRCDRSYGIPKSLLRS